MSSKDTQALIVDVSAGLCKAGFAGDDAPRAVFSSAVTHTRHSSVMFSAKHEATLPPHTIREMITEYPVDEHGIMTNRDDMEKIWHRTFYSELHVAPVDHPVLLTEVTLNPRPNRERTTQIVLETFGVPAMTYQGCAVDSGDVVSFIVPVHEGYAVHDAIGRLDIGARGMIDLLMRTLDSEHHGAGGGYLLKDSTIGSKIAWDIREKLTYVALDFDEELQAALQDPSRFEKSYALLDETVVVVGSERSRTPEALFQLWLLGKETGQGLHVCAFQGIRKCATEIQQDLYSNILLSGVNTECPGFEARVAKELVALAPSAMSIKVVGPPEDEYAVWRGGSILASLSSFQEMWISAAEYGETGPSIVHRKCI